MYKKASQTINSKFPFSPTMYINNNTFPKSLVLKKKKIQYNPVRKQKATETPEVLHTNHIHILERLFLLLCMQVSAASYSNSTRIDITVIYKLSGGS